MSVDATLAVLYAQSSLSNQANAAMVAPQASLAMTRVLAAEAMRQERQQVEKNEKTDKALIHKDGGRGASFMTRRRARSRAQEPEEEAARPKSPIIGNLLNLKV